ncbi:unnamed protein product [Dovyalis caffra]|uniref:DUF642 domain-containing protein n=1 Tax=Dovyalis caffra TaxID=77055 RepID=A0AAV1R9R5_9ROSI|nr:unnamed protein product [Dovyalis caffra]
MASSPRHPRFGFGHLRSSRDRVRGVREEKLNISVSPEWGVLPMQTMYSSNGWDSYAWAFKAPLDIVDFVIHNPGVEEDLAIGPLIDSSGN